MLRIATSMLAFVMTCSMATSAWAEESSLPAAGAANSASESISVDSVAPASSADSGATAEEASASSAVEVPVEPAESEGNHNVITSPESAASQDIKIEAASAPETLDAEGQVAEPAPVNEGEAQPLGITELDAQKLIDEGLITDPNFAQAIADSINAQPDQFLDNKSMGDFNSYEELLNNFTGTINAASKGIADITGFHHLRRVQKVDLSNNNIQDLTPIAGYGPTSVNDLYYGKTDRPYQNVEIDVSGNPLFHLPTIFGGMLDWTGGNTGAAVIRLEPFKFVSTSGSSEQFSASFNFGATYGGILATVDDSLGTTAFTDGYDMNWNSAPKTGGDEKLQIKKRENDYLLSIQNISMTGNGIANISVFGSAKFYNSKDPGSASEASYSVQWSVPIVTEIYNKIEVKDDVNTSHGLTFTKTNEDGQKQLSGAVYELSKGGTLVGTYTTGADGTFNIPSDVLQGGGTFELKEVQAPAGYEIGDNPVTQFTLTDGSISVSADAGKEVSTNDGATQDTITIGNGTFALGGVEDAGIELDIKLPTMKVGDETYTGSLKSLTVTRTEGNNQGAGKQTFYGENAEADALEYIRDAVKHYANVTIAAEFSMDGAFSQENPRVPVEVELQAEKNVDGKTDAQAADAFEFELALTSGNGDNVKTADGEPFTSTTARNDANGSVSFGTLKIDKPGTYTFQVTEQGEKHFAAGDGTKYEKDTSVFTVEVVVKEVSKEEADASAGSDTPLAQGALKVESITYKNGETKADAIVFNNRKLVDIDVTKLWQEYGEQVTNPTHLPSGVTGAEITLLQDGKPAGQKLMLTEANGWKGSFENLYACTPDGKEIEYSVQETAIEGYQTKIERDNNSAFGYKVTNSFTNMLMIDNVLQRPNDASKTDMGGFVEMTGTNDRDKRPYEEQQTQVSWWPDEYWSHADSFVVKVFDTQEQVDNDTPVSTVTVNIPKNPDGTVNLQKLQEEVAQKLPGATVTVDADQKITLTLADDAADMPYATEVDVSFVPSLKIHNETPNDEGGKVSVDGGTPNNVEDGRRDEETDSGGKADDGWRVDTGKLGIKHPGTGEFTPVRPDANGNFSVTINDPYAGEVTVTGKVVYEYDKDGNVIRADIQLDKLPISLDTCVVFERIPPKPTDPAPPAPPTTTTVPQTGDTTPLALMVACIAAGLLMAAGALAINSRYFHYRMPWVRASERRTKNRK